MTEPLTRNRVNIKAILADPLLREELIEGATDFICKVEGIRRRKEDLEMTDLSPAAQAVLDAADSAFGQVGTTRQGIAAALCAAAMQTLLFSEHYEGSTPNDYELGWDAAVAYIQNIAAELEGGND